MQTYSEYYNRLIVMRNLVKASEAIEEARSLVGDCYINRLPDNDPLHSACESVRNVLFRGGMWPEEAMTPDRTLDLLILAGKAAPHNERPPEQ